MELVQNRLRTDLPAHHNAHHQSTDGHGQALRQHIHKVQHGIVPAGGRRPGEHTGGTQTVDPYQHRNCENGKADQKRHLGAVSLSAFLLRPVQEIGDVHLDQGDGGGNGGDQHQQIEDHAEQRAGGAHGPEHIL